LSFTIWKINKKFIDAILSFIQFNKRCLMSLSFAVVQNLLKSFLVYKKCLAIHYTG
jgi:hypothetical protein